MIFSGACALTKPEVGVRETSVGVSAGGGGGGGGGGGAPTGTTGEETGSGGGGGGGGGGTLGWSTDPEIQNKDLRFDIMQSQIVH